MPGIFPCDVTDCDEVFTRPYQLKKHKALHDDPNSVFRCTVCGFYSLQKKNLVIHMAIHTGKKDHKCPHPSIINGREHELCEYKTHDPAALSKHRRNVHGYVPVKVTLDDPPRKTRQTKPVGKVTRRCKPTQRIVPSPHRKASRSTHKTKILETSSANAPATPSLRLEDIDGSAMVVDTHGKEFGYDSSSATLVGSDDGIGLDILSDPSLRSEWMAKYEMGYSNLDAKYVSGPFPAISLPDLAVQEVKTGREGCLCPEWMVEAGIEGWDESVLETHKEYYTVHV